MLSEPDYAGGAESDNSILTKLFDKRVFFKNGAEGVFVAIIPETENFYCSKNFRWKCESCINCNCGYDF